MQIFTFNSNFVLILSQAVTNNMHVKILRELSSCKFNFDQISHKVVKKIYSGDIDIPFSQHSHEHVLLLIADVTLPHALTDGHTDCKQASQQI